MFFIIIILIIIIVFYIVIVEGDLVVKRSSYNFASIFLMCFFACAFIGNVSALFAGYSLVNTLYLSALDNYSVGNYAAAIDYFEQTLYYWPEHDDARYYLVYSYKMTGNRPKALEHAQVLAFRYPGAFNDLVKSLRTPSVAQKPARSRRTQGSQVESTFSRSTSRTPRISSAPRTPSVPGPRESPRRTQVVKDERILRAEELIDRMNYNQAIDLLAKMLDDQPKNSEALNLMGHAKFGSGRYADALKFFEKTIAESKGSFEPHFYAGISALNQRLLSEAREHFEASLRFKDDVFVRLNLAEILLHEEELPAAEKMYKEILDSQISLPAAKAGYAEVRLARGFREEARKLVESILKDEPDNVEAQRVMTMVLLETGEYEQALKLAEKLYQKSHQKPELQTLYAASLLRSLNAEYGTEVAQLTVDDHPDYLEAILILAEGFIMNNRIDEAARLISENETEHELAQFNYLRALLKHGKGDVLQAREYYRKYAQATRYRPAGKLNYASFLEIVGDQDSARRVYQSVIDEFPGTYAVAQSRQALQKLSESSAPPERPFGGRPIPGF